MQERAVLANALHASDAERRGARSDVQGEGARVGQGHPAVAVLRGLAGGEQRGQVFVSHGRKLSTPACGVKRAERQVGPRAARVGLCRRSLSRKVSRETATHIVVERLQKRFGSAVVLNDIDMTIRRGEVAVVIGGSGAGKTTLLKILIGLERATSGSIKVNDEEIVGLSERELNRVRQRFGMVFQYSALLDSMNVLDNVAFPLREHSKLSEREIRDKVREKLGVLGLPNTEEKFPSELSGGMRKRVGLARALMMEPEAVLYDEPTSGLDPITSRKVDDLIVETRDRFGVTSIVISHDMAGALRIADQIVLLANGRVVAAGPPRELVAHGADLLSEFIESSGIEAERLLSERTSMAAPEPKG
jgi:phospholipid/cholesterol/gamma-HCH transport system ATP-binding protein